MGSLDEIDAVRAAVAKKGTNSRSPKGAAIPATGDGPLWAPQADRVKQPSCQILAGQAIQPAFF